MKRKDKTNPIIKDKTNPNISYTPYMPKRIMNIKSISPDELIFAYEWANNPNNPKKALLSAGITNKNSPPSEVEALSYEYQNNPQVREAFQESLFHRMEQLSISESKIDSYLKVMAMTDIGLSKDNKGDILPLERMPWEIRMCIQEYQEKTFYPPQGDPYKRVKIKFYDRKDALKALRQNKKDDKALQMGIIKGNGFGDTFIQNNIHSIHNGDNIGGDQVSYNSELKSVINLSLLSETELDVFLKATGQNIPQNFIEAETMVNDIKKEEDSL